MRTIAVVCFKGGTGKSATVCNVATALARRGQRVAVVDLDASGNATAALGHEHHKSGGMYAVLHDDVNPAAVALDVEPNLILYPANDALDLLNELEPDALQTQLEKLHDATILLDTPPSYRPITRAALYPADEVWTPIALDGMSMKGLAKVLRILALMERRHRPVLRYIIPQFIDMRRRRDRGILQALRERFTDRLTPGIRVNTDVAEAMARGRPIFDYRPSSNGAQDYAALADFILGGQTDGKETR